MGLLNAFALEQLLSPLERGRIQWQTCREAAKDVEKGGILKMKKGR